MTLFIIVASFSSISIVLNVRKKRNEFNTNVLKDSNLKLSDLVYLLKCSI
jgi:hypothetical protein